jgi:chromate reductase
MNICVLVGSLRKDSYNRKLYNAYQQLSDGQMCFKEINTALFPHYNSDLEPNKPNVIHEYAQDIRESDAVLFFTPEYNYSLPGHLKNAIDWLSRLDNQPFNGKKSAILGGSPGYIGTARMQYELRKIGVFLNIHFLNKPEVMVGQLYGKFDADGNLNDDNTRTFLLNHIEAMRAFVA